MDFENLANEGFQGFVSIDSLQKSQCSQIVDQPGIYLILNSDKTHPIFLPQSKGFTGKKSFPQAELELNWVEDSLIVYIGKAGGETHKTSLRKRLNQYMRYGLGKNSGHQGGRSIWQIKHCNDLLVCWKPTPNEEPRAVEKRLIQEFVIKYGKRPFANRTG